MPCTCLLERTVTPSSYQVNLEVFEGPLDLLLRLIEREELDITLISLARVTDQYLGYLAGLRERSAANLADFCAIAAQLLVIKSRVLLPRPPSATAADADEGDDLVERLREYRRFRQAAEQLGALESAGRRTYPRLAPLPRLEPRLQPGEADAGELLAALQRVLAQHPPQQPVNGVVAPVTVRIAERIAAILARLETHGKVSFAALLGSARSRLEVIVTFLALLELIKQQRVRALQPRPFGEIDIVPREPDAAEEIPATDLSEYGDGS
jgi:segregation and condensation protein A